MNIFILLLIFLPSIFSSSEGVAGPVFVGGSHTVNFDYDGARNSTGIQRELHSGGGVQYFHFCTKDGKNKDKCGAWVDEKGKKIAGANNNVKRVAKGGQISKMQTKDSGRYSRYPSDPDANIAYLQSLNVYVQEIPPHLKEDFATSTTTTEAPFLGY